MEVWTLDHPEAGRIAVEIGFDAEFVAQSTPDNPWPQEVPTDKNGNDIEYFHVSPTAGLKERKKALTSNPPLRMRMSVNGQVVKRLTNVPQGKVSLKREMKKELTSPTTAVGSQSMVKITKTFDDQILMLEYRNGSEVVEFEPPAGSKGEHRKKQMEESSFKRWAFPLMEGLGKGGWALAVIVLGPLASRVIEWILSLFPDWDLPDWDLPSLPSLPDIHLPTIPSPPDINLPVIPMPDWDLPDFQVPDWAMFMIDYSKIWVPVLIGVVIGIIAIKNHQKSERTKQEWEAEQKLKKEKAEEKAEREANAKTSSGE